MIHLVPLLLSTVSFYRYTIKALDGARTRVDIEICWFFYGYDPVGEPHTHTRKVSAFICEMLVDCIKLEYLATQDTE